jgi:hypothetical protein
VNCERRRSFKFFDMSPTDRQSQIRIWQLA